MRQIIYANTLNARTHPQIKTAGLSLAPAVLVNLLLRLY